MEDYKYNPMTGDMDMVGSTNNFGIEWNGDTPIPWTGPTVVDNLNSTSANDALSAKQGKILNDSKADKKPRVTAIPADGHYEPNVLYVLALDGTARTITLNAAAAGLAAEYHMFLKTGAEAPEITWPQDLTWKGGNGPTIVANHTYEISIVEGRAYSEDWGASV